MTIILWSFIYIIYLFCTRKLFWYAKCVFNDRSGANECQGWSFTCDELCLKFRLKPWVELLKTYKLKLQFKSHYERLKEATLKYHISLNKRKAKPQKPLSSRLMLAFNAFESLNLIQKSIRPSHVFISHYH